MCSCYVEVVKENISPIVMPVLDESWVEDDTAESEGFVYVSDVQYEQEFLPPEPPIVPKNKCYNRNSSSKLKSQAAIQILSTSKPSKPKTTISNDINKMTSSPDTHSEEILASSPTGSDLQHNFSHLRLAELFPKRNIEKEDESLEPPFEPICGEAIEYLGRTQDGVLALSDYRIFHKSIQGATTNIPLMLVEVADVRDIFFLHIMCKDARSLRCTFATGEKCLEWQRKISNSLLSPDSLDKFFAFSYKAWASEPGGEEVLKRLTPLVVPDSDAEFINEFSRLEFDGSWRTSHVNKDYKLCSSYPPLLVVPSDVSDESLECVAKFRSSRRIPAVVWRHRGNGAIIARCSQPEVGWLGWRSNDDEQLLAAISSSCLDKESKKANISPKKLLIIDARSYTSAVTNRARGGGYECSQYYPGAEIQFMSLPNIHSVRKSFQALRALAAEPPDHANWHSVLEKSLWLQAVGGLLRAATIVARAVHVGARPTLVHCSDGWDRTPQIVSTAELLLDPYYRTCEGFKTLVEREWLDFGHKFADRCGHTVGTDDPNERCPVFLQWLDCVHQLLVQYPCCFEFSQAYLIKLAQHAYSCLFGTFLCNNRRDRKQNHVYEKTFSVWNFLRGPSYRNHLYEPNKEVLYPAHSARVLVVWAAVYLGVAPDTPAPVQPPTSPPPPAHSTSFNCPPTNGTMTKTRSYQDLSTLSEHMNTAHRRSSDPNIALDPMKRSTLSLSGTICSDSSANNKNFDMPYTHSFSNDNISDLLLKGKIEPKFMTSQIRDRFTGDSLINTTVTKHNVNGYSYKENGNVPVDSSISGSIDLTNMIDSNCNSKPVKGDEVDSINQAMKSAIFENGNMDALESDGFRSLEDSDHHIFPIEDISIPSKTAANYGHSPTDDSSFNGVFSEMYESSMGGQNINEISNRRSESEGSQHTDSSCVDLISDILQSDSIPARGTDVLRRYDSVQNGDINAANANLLETEVENATNRLSEQCRISLSLENNHSSKLESTGSFQYYSPPKEVSEMTLCPNSPHRTFQRTQSVGASSALATAHSHISTCAPDSGGYLSEGKSESCYLSRLHHYDSHGCNATHFQCLLHCYTHCTHSKESSRSNNISNLGPMLDPVDGLVCPQSPIQHRLHQIIQDHKMREEALRKELHAARVELQQRASRTVRPTPDNVEDDFSNNVSTESVNPQVDWNSFPIVKSFSYSNDPYFDDDNRRFSSTASEYPCSDSSSGTGDGSVCGSITGGVNLGQWTDVGSSSSGPRCGSGMASSVSTTLWVPDHAVSSCTRCGTSFWLGKRKHHCRRCGKIFCAECSEKTSPLPNEQLFNPVRVCLECYASLSNEERNMMSEQSIRPSQIGTKSRQIPVTSSIHSSTQEVRPISDYCKQVSGDQKLNSSPVTAASN